MTPRPRLPIAASLTLGLVALAFAQAPASVATLPGMPPVVDPSNLYSETAAGKLSPAVAGDLPRVYVPNLRSNDVYGVRSTSGSAARGPVLGP